jgi:hypothetical protein
MSTHSVDSILASIKSFETADLFKLMKVALSEAEKKSKQTKAATAVTAAAKKTGSMPKGTVPPQLKKPRAWVEYTLKHAQENGWEAFTIIQKKKDNDIVIEEQIEMPASVLHNGTHIYKDSITEKNPNGRQIIHKDAMSLSKQRKDAAHPSYAEFEAQYVDESSDDDKSEAKSMTSGSESDTTSKKIVVKKTVAEKEAEKAAKKAEKEAEKAAKKAEKEAEKAAKEAEKEVKNAAKKSPAKKSKE